MAWWGHPVAYLQLPVSALPQVDYPTIQILTFYPGASPEVMASSVTTPLERQFGQLPGLSKMTSTSSSGASLMTLQFNPDLNIDVAEQQEPSPGGIAFRQGGPGDMRRAGPCYTARTFSVLRRGHASLQGPARQAG